MINENYFETYFYLSRNKLIISVFQKNNSIKIYDKVLENENNLKDIDYSKVEIFLEENIIQIEKITKNFLNEIYLVIEHKESLHTSISLKINNDRNIITEDDINYLLKDAKQQIKQNYFNRSIIHMIIDSYLFDGIKYTYLPKEQNCSNFCLDIKFICISKKMIKKLELIFQRHHIFIGKIICANYAKDFFSKETLDICTMARNIHGGCNENEIMLIPKTSKKKGIFERFFHFFS
jgi:cell division ATPase FtsA